MFALAPGDLVAIGGAVVLAAFGGEAFLKGVLGIAGWLRLPKILVATTLAAFATSSPELTVSTTAALAGQPEIGLGEALGSNVVNIALIFGLALLFEAAVWCCSPLIFASLWRPLWSGGASLPEEKNHARPIPHDALAC